jgi:Fumarylacetoacetate (FAA) hydrolase family
MKLVTSGLCGRDRIGAVVDSAEIDLNAACSASLEAAGEREPAGTADRFLPADMLAFLRAGDAATAPARSVLRFDEIVAFVSSFWTLEPGDLITTASPMAGPIFSGDVIESEIEGLGLLRNRVESIPADPVCAERVGI